MKSEIYKVLQLTHFFKISQSTLNVFSYNLNKPSMLLMKNIYINWLQTINAKTAKHLPLFTHRKFSKDKQNLPFGFLKNSLVKYDEDTLLEYNIEDCAPKTRSHLELNLFVPEHDIMQYFIQWQRYRKYWWSSITTTPSLFAINEINYEADTADVNIVGLFPWGQHTVETISAFSRKNNTSQLKCSMSLECAMFILLLDGLNNTREEYLRLHRNMAPYKISFALQFEETRNKSDLNGLADLMYYRLKSKDIAAYIPNFTETMEKQVPIPITDVITTVLIQQNLQLGVTYTAILNENTLTNGIFHLLSSSTMLKEEVHVADFDSYADLLCRN